MSQCRQSFYALGLSVFILSGVSLQAAEAKKVKGACDKVANWIIEKYVVADKAFSGEQGKDLTTVAMIVAGLCTHPRDYKETNGPFVSEPVKFLVAQIKDDGSLAGADNSALAWVAHALHTAKNPKYDALLAKLPKAHPCGEANKPEKLGNDLPSMQHLFYKAMHTASKNKEELKTLAGEVADELLKLQQKNGSFGDNLQVNALALLALNQCYAGLK